MGEELQGAQGRRHGHDLRRLLQGLRGGGEAEGPRAHLAHQGEHHPEQAPAVLRRHAHVRHTARRHRQVAELPHWINKGGRRRLQAHVPEDHQQPAKRHLQPRRALLQPGEEPRPQGGQDGQQGGRRDAVLDQGRVPPLLGGHLRQTTRLLRFRGALLDGHTLRRAHGAHALGLPDGDVGAAHKQVLPAPARRGRDHEAEDAQIGAYDQDARVPPRRDGGVHRAARRRRPPTSACSL